jgi:hypothetical protein
MMHSSRFFQIRTNAGGYIYARAGHRSFITRIKYEAAVTISRLEDSIGSLLPLFAEGYGTLLPLLTEGYCP